MTLLDRILPTDDLKRKAFAIGLTTFLAGLMTVWGIYGYGSYGMALFILTPLFIGAAPVLLYGYKKSIKQYQAVQMGFLTLAVFTLWLLFYAIEGLICIAMAAPLGLLMTWVGAMIGFAIHQLNADKTPNLLLILLALIPTLGFMEKDWQPKLSPVVTSIDIDAPPATVWKNVVAFPQLDKPTEFIFKTGIAYPINATINGSGVGAVRHCNFTTGSFVEPITIWNEPRLLRFDVLEQPAPMKELSFWDIDAPHLHDFFVSKQGQFKLIALPDGKTRLEGTTWYYHNIKPDFYWRMWSDLIVHKIHERVLKHIKKTAENKGNH
jgi:hypothetical protein